jgi:periplasmic protein CpxP/Spy
MKSVDLAVRSGTRSDCQDGVRISRMDGLPLIYFARRADVRSIVMATTTLCMISSCASAQTTRTSPSAASTSKSIPSSSSTSPNSPCSPTNPTSPCYSANAPRNPCYSAVAPDEPCSTTVTPSTQNSPPPSKPATAVQHSTERAFTADQAKSQIEAEGYSNVSALRKDNRGIWRGKAVKEGLPVNVTIDAEGKITAN